MYLRRFKNRNKRQLLNLKGRFSLIHLGGGTFLYSYPGKYYPVVRKLEFGRKKYRVRGYGLMIGFSLFFGVMSVLSNAGTADSISLEDLERLEAGLTPLEIVDQSELIRQRLVSDGETERRDSRRGTQIIEYRVRPGDTLSSIAARYRVPIEMITSSSRLRINSVIREGQVLIIPSRKGLVYRFRRGDTLARVAQYYSVRLEDVIQDNPSLEDLDIVPLGMRVFLPNAKIPAPPPVWFRPARGRITSGFGRRRHPILRTVRMHTGVDIAMYYRAVRAARSGHVTFAGRLGSYGLTIILEHRGGYKTMYGHLSRILVRKGQYVRARRRIAISGNSGLSTGPHLHFEIIRNGRAMNPRRRIRF